MQQVSQPSLSGASAILHPSNHASPNVGTIATGLFPLAQVQAAARQGQHGFVPEAGHYICRMPGCAYVSKAGATPDVSSTHRKRYHKLSGRLHVYREAQPQDLEENRQRLKRLREKDAERHVKFRRKNQLPLTVRVHARQLQAHQESSCGPTTAAAALSVVLIGTSTGSTSYERRR